MTKTIDIRLALIAAVLMAAIALPAFVHADQGSGSRHGKVGIRQNKAMTASSTVDLNCMQTAVDARETALTTAFDELNSSVGSALSARKSALSSAWSISDAKERRTAIIAAMKEWKTARMAAYKEMKSDRKAAWDGFKTAAKACGETVSSEESLGKDSSGELAL